MKGILLSLIAVFVLGNVSGAFVGARFQEERHEKRDKVDNLEVNLLALLERKLTLTPKQMSVIKPMIGEACLEIRGIYRRGADDIEKIVGQYHHRIAQELTAEQDKIFKELEAERKQQAEGSQTRGLGD